MNSITVVKNIRKIRIYKNYTQEFVAKQAGLNLTTYVLMERGKIEIKLATLFTIAKNLGVDYEVLLQDELQLFKPKPRAICNSYLNVIIADVFQTVYLQNSALLAILNNS